MGILIQNLCIVDAKLVLVTLSLAVAFDEPCGLASQSRNLNLNFNYLCFPFDRSAPSPDVKKNTP